MEGEAVDYDPLLLPDIEPAIQRLRRALDEGELIAVYGDFDVDGVTASAILTDGLRGLGGHVLPYLPDRFTEGYGLNTGAIDRLREQGAGLIVTADCGTSSMVEVEHARKLGLDTIVLDHHSVPPELPAAVAVVNPKLPGSRYPEPELATGGIAFKVMAALHEALRKPWDSDRYLDLVALSTICDVAPLQNENRSLVRRGLAALANTRRPGLRALMESAGIEPARVNAEDLGFGLGPRLNAAGRLAHARLALDLLLERDEGRARAQAAELTRLNQERQRATAAAVELALDALADEDPDAPLLFVGHADIPSGIVGLVASRLVDERYRPAVVYERGESLSRASCRSIPEFDITSALRSCSEMMVRFGGHRAAAGFTAENQRLPELKDALLRLAGGALGGVELTPVLDIDAAVPLHRVDGRLIDLILRLAPFGPGNPEPAFLSRDLEIAGARVVGSDGTHLRLRLRDGRVTWPAIAFGQAAAGVRTGQRIDVVYSFSQDGRGDGGLELRVSDFAPVGAPGRQAYPP